MTAGANWKPTNCITIRPEVRYDWVADGAATTGVGVYDFGTSDNQFTAAIDFILNF